MANTPKVLGPKFSAGPWYITRPQHAPGGAQQVHIMAGKGPTRWGVAHVGIINPDDADIQSANANLIAAAPDLFAALEPFAREAERFADLNLSEAARVEMSLPASLFRMALAALAKARGQQ